MYMSIHEIAMGCVMGQRDELERKEIAIYNLSKKFPEYKSKIQYLKRHVVV